MIITLTQKESEGNKIQIITKPDITCIVSPSLSLEDLPFPEVDSVPDDFSAIAFWSASFLLALAFALADVDKTAVGSFTADAVVAIVVGRGYSNNDGFA